MPVWPINYQIECSVLRHEVEVLKAERDRYSADCNRLNENYSNQSADFAKLLGERDHLSKSHTELLKVCRWLLCSHPTLAGGNDYIACTSGGLEWDYRKIFGDDPRVAREFAKAIIATAEGVQK